MSNLLLSICLLLVCFILLIAILRKLLLALKSYKWKKTDGVICKSKIIKGVGAIESNLIYTENINFKYRYAVNGKKYHNDTISVLCILGISGIIPSRILKKYPKGKSVKVYYSPKTPEKACLEPGIGITYTSPFLILILIMGLTLLFFTFHAALNMFLDRIKEITH